MNIVKQFNLLSAAFPYIFKDLGNTFQVNALIHEHILLPSKSFYPVVRLVFNRSNTPVASELYSNVPEALGHELFYTFCKNFRCRPAGMGVTVDGYPAFSAKKLINRHICTLAFYIP